MLTAKQAKFQLDFMIMMITVGRNDEAMAAYEKLNAYLEAQQ